MPGVVSLPTDVLIVDDEPVVLQVVTQVLRSRGMVPVIESTGEAALTRVANQGFGCVLVDKNLPGIDGLSVIREVKKLQPHCATLIMTAYASTASVVEALRVGATDYLEKPFADIELLAQRIELAMKNQRAQYERDTFRDLIRTYEEQLQGATQALEQQRTEIQLFEDVLNHRVRDATADLCEALVLAQQQLTSATDFDFALKTNIETILNAVREAQTSSDPALAGSRTALARIAFRLEAHLLLLTRKAPLPPNPSPAR